MHSAHGGPSGGGTLRRLWTQIRKIAVAGESWFVVSLVGMSAGLFNPVFPRLTSGPRIGIGIGVNAALISIVTEWLSDLKMGYCYDGWWLNQQFCCWEIDTEGEACDSWHDWSDFTAVRWIVYVIVAVRFVSLDQKQSRFD